MLTYLTLTIALVISAANCEHIELNNEGRVSHIRNVIDDTRYLTTGEYCGVNNRLPFPVYNDLEHGFRSFRASLNSSAMYNIKWSKKLANYAQAKADKCDIGFEFDDNCDAIHHNSLGAISFGNDTEKDIAKFLNSMYSEKEIYHPKINKCIPSGACMDFNFIARDTLSEFGCASTKCKVLRFRDNSLSKNLIRDVCYLTNGKNVNHVPSSNGVPYSINGEVCSKCKDLIVGDFKCVNGLCDEK